MEVEVEVEEQVSAVLYFKQTLVDLHFSASVLMCFLSSGLHWARGVGAAAKASMESNHVSLLKGFKEVCLRTWLFFRHPPIRDLLCHGLQAVHLWRDLNGVMGLS